MFDLDTNVLSAATARLPVPEVATWMRQRPLNELFTTTVTQAEVLSGIAALPAGRRRRDLETTANTLFRVGFFGRVLPFDSRAAEAYAILFPLRRRLGRATSPQDLMIAAIASVHGAPVVTRDFGGFDGLGLTVIDPFVAGA